MPTPAAAGAIVAMIAGALFKNFSISVAVCSITLSFLIGMIVFQSREFRSAGTSKLTKAAFYIVNSLIIFAMATGTTAVMAGELITQERPYFNDWTKQDTIYAPLNTPSNSPYYLSIDIKPEEIGKLRATFQNIGIVQPEFRAKILVTSEDEALLSDIDEVNIRLPSEYFDVPNIKLIGGKTKKEVQIKAWKSFKFDVEVKTKAGEIYLLNDAVLLQ